jgi:hypothetical protein
MRIFELHNRVRFWVDTVKSTRFESIDIDNAINIAIDNKWRESYDSNRIMNHSDAFQKIQRIRDELGPLVKKVTTSSTGISLSVLNGKTIINNALTDYGYLLSLKIISDNGEFPAESISLKRKNILSNNPFRNILSSLSRKCYYSELDGNIELEQNIGTISDIELYYLAYPILVSYGTERTNGYTFITEKQVMAIDTVIYNSVTYLAGSVFTIASGESQTSGTVIEVYVESIMGETTHEEISRRAAINCLLSVGYFDKIKELRQEIMAS